MKQKYIMLLDPVKYPAVISHPRHRLWWILRILQMVEAFKTIYLHKEGKVKGSIYLVNYIICHVQMFLKLL